MSPYRETDAPECATRSPRPWWLYVLGLGVVAFVGVGLVYDPSHVVWAAVPVQMITIMIRILIADCTTDHRRAEEKVRAGRFCAVLVGTILMTAAFAIVMDKESLWW